MSGAPADARAPQLRLDKWLWHARFMKSRSLAAKLCQSGRIRLNDERVAKPHQAVKPGDVLTFPLGPHIRIVRIVDLGQRRGPATEARLLYEDLAPPPDRTATPVPPRDGARPPGSGRPTKAARRAIDDLIGQNR